MNNTLRRLYDASEEDMTYGIGTMDLGAGPPVPIICIRYRNWSRAQLEVVRETFHAGIMLTHTEPRSGQHHIRLATREMITIEHAEGVHTGVLRAPAWDAQLNDVDAEVYRLFEYQRQRRHCFLLLIQTSAWEFTTACGDVPEQTTLSDVLPCGTPLPIPR